MSVAFTGRIKCAVFGVVRMSGYDIIAMETDLPPIDDWTTSGTKTTVVEQRVQGIVVFKYDYVNHTWSSHRVMDVVDNQHDRALSNIRLTVYDGMVYATYFRNHNGKTVLCITKSANGIDWENPTYSPEMTTPYFDQYPVSLVRNGKYMYLISGNPRLCYRALATDYMGVACTENTFDVTNYVTNASLSTGSKISSTVILGDPTVNVAATGYGLAGLWRGEVTNHDLFATLRAMRATLSLGYRVNGENLLIQKIYGIVTEVTRKAGTTGEISLEIADLSILSTASGNSDSNEWFSTVVAGDHFAALYADDETGTSGLKHTVIKSGTWTGGSEGLKHTCADDEGFAITNLIPQSFNSRLMADASFYDPIESPVKLTGTTPP